MTACPTCGADPCINPSFCATCRDADRRKARGKRPQYMDKWPNWPEWPASVPHNWDEMSLDQLWSVLNDPRRRPMPEVTVQAVLHAVRSRGAKALKEATTRERLSRCDAAAIARINEQVAKLKAGGKC